MKLFKIFIITAALLIGFPELVLAERAPAMINPGAMAIAKPSRIFYGTDGQEISPELIAAFNVFKKDVLSFDASKVIPMNMAASNDSSSVFARIIDKSASYFASTDTFRSSPFGKTTTEVEHTLKQEVVVSEGLSGVQHKLNLNIQALQTCAELQYTGIMRAAVKYTVASSTLGFEVAEKVFANKDLVLSQSYGAERVSEVSLRWAF